MISSVVKLSELYYYLNLNTKSNLSTFSGDGQTFRQIQRIKENFYHEVEDDVEMIKRTGRTTPIIV